MDGAAFDLEEVDAVFGEGFEGREKRAGAMGETHGEGDFARLGRDPRRGFFFRQQEDEAREILGVVLDAFGKNQTTVMFGGTAAGNRGAGFVPLAEHFANAASGVFGGHALQIRMGGEEALALCESHGMRGHGTNSLERCIRTADKMVLDGENRFRNDGKLALQQKVIDADDRPGERVFHGSKERVGCTFIDGAESGVERCTWNSRDVFAEKLNSGSFAEGAGFALEGYAHSLAIECGHEQALSCNKDRKTKSGDSSRCKKISVTL